MPNLSTTYSNEAFALLGLAFYRATGGTYGELIYSEIVEPLNVTNTGVSPGNTSRGVIPTDNSFWGGLRPECTPGRALFQHQRPLKIRICNLKSHNSG